MHTPLSMHHLATSRPMPGSPLLNLSLFLIHSLPQPVLKNTASPSLTSASCMFCFCSRAQVGDGDLLASLHHIALHSLDVEQVAAGEERLAVLHAELLQPIGAVNLELGHAVVVAHLVLVAV